MANHPTIGKHVAESGAFQDKDPRVLITSGESFTPYFVNAEKLCMDKNLSKFLEANEDNAAAIIEHSMKLANENASFKEDIEITI